MIARLRLPPCLAALALGAGCGGSGSSSPPVPSIAPARSFALIEVRPSAPVPANRPVTVGFTLREPSGEPLVRYRTGAGPHTGVHVILVRDDLSQIIHRHPPVRANGHVSVSLRFPAPGRWHLLVDAYPNLGPSQPRNFQLSRELTVSGTATPRPVPPFRSSVTVDGVTFHMTSPPRVRSLEATFLTVRVTDRGRPAGFTPWFGALGHAIFFRRGSLAYFHTHICGPSTPGCVGGAGAPVSGRSTLPGLLRVGVLLPQAGTWRLFLQARVGGRVVTAPFTLEVR